jgi:hypothetical protein
MSEGHQAAFPTHTARVNRAYLSKPEKGASYSGLKIIAKLAPDAGPPIKQITGR